MHSNFKLLVIVNINESVWHEKLREKGGQFGEDAVKAQTKISISSSTKISHFDKVEWTIFNPKTAKKQKRTINNMKILFSLQQKQRKPIALCKLFLAECDFASVKIQIIVIFLISPLSRLSPLFRSQHTERIHRKSFRRICIVAKTLQNPTKSGLKIRFQFFELACPPGLWFPIYLNDTFSVRFVAVCCCMHVGILLSLQMLLL